MEMPDRWTASMIGSMSACMVRAAQLGSMGILCFAISEASATTSSAILGPAPGSPMSAEWIPRSAIKWRISIFSPIVGDLIDGDCIPSRRVSSSSSTLPIPVSGNSTRFQS